MAHIITIIAILAFIGKDVLGYFDATRDCPSQALTNPCHCTSTEIECIHRAIYAVPNFTKTNYPFKVLQLGNNMITTLHSRTFQNVNVTEILLNDNMISFIDFEAFLPLQDQLELIDLRNNKITYISNAFLKLSTLHMLDVSYNPIPDSNFTDDVMRELGDYIHDFSFGDPKLQGWPSTIHHFQQLKKLKFYEGQMDRIPITAFSGFEWTLRELWMQYTNLIAVPIALQDLKSTTELHFDNNIHVYDAGILIPAFAGLTTCLHTMTLENNSLTTFPQVLRTLRQLHNLSLARNNLQYVSDQAVSEIGSELTTLNLQQCNLDRIPGALSKRISLINLDFSYNNITTIEKNDLQHMTRLKSLNVSYNPLQYISKSTFYDLRSLDELMLKETNLFQVPEALTNIPNLSVVNLDRSTPQIECNCDLSWLNCFIAKNNTKLHVVGHCFTIEMDIETYAKERISQVCPNMC